IKSLAIAGGCSDGGVAGLRMIRLDSWCRDDALPKLLAGLLVKGERGQFFRLVAIGGQKDFASMQNGCRLSGIDRHAPAQRVGCVEAIRQRSGRRSGDPGVVTTSGWCGVVGGALA